MMRRYTKAMKDKQREFILKTEAMLRSLGADESDQMYPFTLETEFGPLGISIHDQRWAHGATYISAPGAWLLGVVCCRFRDPAFEDRKVPNASPNGKWNFHFSWEEGTPSECVENLRLALVCQAKVKIRQPAVA